jgi:hypothetical protein
MGAHSRGLLQFLSRVAERLRRVDANQLTRQYLMLLSCFESILSDHDLSQCTGNTRTHFPAEMGLLGWLLGPGTPHRHPECGTEHEETRIVVDGDRDQIETLSMRRRRIFSGLSDEYVA